MSDIALAIEKLGGLTKAGRALGTSKGVVYRWRLVGAVPPPYCPKIEALTGIICERLDKTVDWAFVRNSAHR